MDKPSALADPGDLAGAFRVARWRVGGAIATSFKRVVTGRVSNSVFLALGSRTAFDGLAEGWVSCSQCEAFVLVAEEVASLSSEDFGCRFILAEDLVAARTEGLKSASIRLRIKEP